jgi:hypothetical protein
LKKRTKKLLSIGSAQAGAGTRLVVEVREQKFFASFFQKRSLSFFYVVSDAASAF